MAFTRRPLTLIYVSLHMRGCSQIAPTPGVQLGPIRKQMPLQGEIQGEIAGVMTNRKK